MTTFATPGRITPAIHWAALNLGYAAAVSCPTIVTCVASAGVIAAAATERATILCEQVAAGEISASRALARYSVTSVPGVGVIPGLPFVGGRIGEAVLNYVGIGGGPFEEC
jgi:hypothetical protein